MPRLRTVLLVVTLLVLATGVWAGFYAYDKGFTKKWRRVIAEELQRRGITARIDKLTLDPFQGLVARGVTVYDDEGRTRVLAEVNQLALDIDLAQLLKKRDFLQRINVRSADLFLPLDPDDRRGRRLEIRDVDARISMLGDTIEISEVSALFYGVRVSVNGSLLKPLDASRSDLSEEERERRTRDRMDALMRRRDVIWRIVDGLAEFGFDPARPPDLAVEIAGDLEDIETAEIRAVLRCGPTSFRGYRIESLALDGGYARGVVTLRSLEITDAKGRLTGFASYHREDPDSVPFTLDSSLDLAAIAASLAPRKELNEVVFYAPPEVRLEGEFLPAAFRAGKAFPLRALGSLSTGMVTSRGVIVEGMRSDFSVEPDRFYVRNGTIQHASGHLRFDAISEPGSGVRWRARMTADPALLMPFATTDGARRFLQRIGWTEDSQLLAEAEGFSPSLAPRTWSLEGRAEARRFTFNGIPIDQVESDVRKEGAQWQFDRVHGKRPEGTVTASRIQYDLDTRLVLVEGGHSTADPIAVTAVAAPRVATFLQRFRFASPPETRAAGIIDIRDKVATDFHAEFVSEDTLRYAVAGDDREFPSSQGRVHVRGRDVGMNLTGTLAGGTELWRTRFDDACRVTVSGWFLRERTTPGPLDLDVRLEPEGRVTHTLFGRPLPLHAGRADIELEGRDAGVHATASLFDGSVSLAGRWSDIGTDQASYRATVAASRVGFHELAKLYSQTSDTEGVVSGSFAFSGRTGSPNSLAGTGTVAIADSNLYAVPIFGPLSTLISLALPTGRVGYSVAREATATFTVADGLVSTDDFEALTPAFRLKSWGAIDYVNDEVDLRARMNLRGAPGFVLLPVSKLFEYQGEGTIGDPVWTSVTLDGLTGGALSDAAVRNRERAQAANAETQGERETTPGATADPETSPTTPESSAAQGSSSPVRPSRNRPGPPPQRR